MRVLAISGSLRTQSTNSALVRTIATVAPETTEFTFYDGVGALPHFSPDLDTDDVPQPVQALRIQLQSADAVLICTPEYAHGMPGSLKNLLDWLVSSGEFDAKPTMAISASPSAAGGNYALAWLVQILAVLGAVIPPAATLPISFIRSRLNPDGELTDHAAIKAVRAGLTALSDAVANGK